MPFLSGEGAACAPGRVVGGEAVPRRAPGGAPARATGLDAGSRGRKVPLAPRRPTPGHYEPGAVGLLALRPATLRVQPGGRPER